jgi:hypothetical protein
MEINHLCSVFCYHHVDRTKYSRLLYGNERTYLTYGLYDRIDNIFSKWINNLSLLESQLCVIVIFFDN